MSNYLYKGMRWALTEEAQKLIDLLTKNGVDEDLAFSLLDNQARSGVLPEASVYSLPTANEVTRPPHRD